MWTRTAGGSGVDGVAERIVSSADRDATGVAADSGSAGTISAS
jgi:hypothetical protein